MQASAMLIFKHLSEFPKSSYILGKFTACLRQDLLFLLYSQSNLTPGWCSPSLMSSYCWICLGTNHKDYFLSMAWEVIWVYCQCRLQLLSWFSYISNIGVSIFNSFSLRSSLFQRFLNLTILVKFLCQNKNNITSKVDRFCLSLVVVLFKQDFGAGNLA